MADIMNKILIFGGAFNPPHIGHLQILQKAISFIRPQKTIICVDKISPWKSSSQLAPYSYRLTMVNNLLKDNVTYDVYPNKNNLIYTCDIIKEIRMNNPDAELFFLVGQDQYELITTWNNYDLINSLCTIVCYKRGHKQIKRINDKHIILAGQEIQCSSSDLRNEIKVEDVGEQNFDYIQTHGLYLQTRVQSYMTQRRFEHTLRVLDTITKIASSNDFSDEEILKCQTAALLHDIAKQYTDQQLRAIISNDELAKFPTYHCAHGLAGARLAQKDFKINDPLILDAIENHVIFKDLNSTNKIAKALFLADKLEPARTEADIHNRAKLFESAKQDLDSTFKVVYKLNGEKY
ncbi:MAG: bis(5'-nucleosyl)-tetraphosphatase (symmetrical) YqeK [Mycoplasma sp.]|nr:bis(5'-nucleosyl)-tetraphosphatase (symmetrical) YqeK [Candidatus Hennigella equi]